MSEPAIHRFTHPAMATLFELRIVESDGEYARQAAAAAFAELDRLEGELSRFAPASDVSRINALCVGEAIRVGAATMECLLLAERVRAETGGAFDVTCGSRRGDHAAGPLELDPAQMAVGVLRAGVMIDLGGIGKGCAIDAMAALLTEWSIESALIEGGTSTALALGRPPGETSWTVGARDPIDPDRALERVRLDGRALSGSAQAGRDHIIDPRTGTPATGSPAAWAAAPTAIEADALSTAFVVMMPDEVVAYCDARRDVGAMLFQQGQVLRLGRW